MKRILIVEDDTSIVEVLKIILGEYGYKTEYATSPTEVMKSIKKVLPDLVLLDIWISGSDGREIAQLLRKNSLTRQVPIVIISAHEDTQKIAKESGAVDFILKPFDIDTLVEKVNKYSSF